MQTELFLVDTSAWIFVLRKDFVPQIKDRVDSLLKENIILTTGIIKLELLGGTRTREEYLRLKSRLSVLDEVKTDSALWNASFELAFSMRRKGITVPYTDIIIAVCAQSRNATLIHADAHFNLISEHGDLQIESYIDIATRRTT